jgi:hypothetical protein
MLVLCVWSRANAKLACDALSMKDSHPRQLISCILGSSQNRCCVGWTDFRSCAVFVGFLATPRNAIVTVSIVELRKVVGQLLTMVR